MWFNMREDVTKDLGRIQGLEEDDELLIPATPLRRGEEGTQYEIHPDRRKRVKKERREQHQSSRAASP